MFKIKGEAGIGSSWPYVIGCLSVLSLAPPPKKKMLQPTRKCAASALWSVLPISYIENQLRALWSTHYPCML